jgi:hypothetical protein
MNRHLRAQESKLKATDKVVIPVETNLTPIADQSDTTNSKCLSHRSGYNCSEIIEGETSLLSVKPLSHSSSGSGQQPPLLYSREAFLQSSLKTDRQRSHSTALLEPAEWDPRMLRYR